MAECRALSRRQIAALPAQHRIESGVERHRDGAQLAQRDRRKLAALGASYDPARDASCATELILGEPPFDADCSKRSAELLIIHRVK
jgi:hypothetical protein